MGFLEGLGRSRAITGTLSAIDQLKANEQNRAINEQNLRLNEMDLMQQQRKMQYEQQQLDAQAADAAQMVDVNYSPIMLRLHPETRELIKKSALESGVIDERGWGQKGAWQKHLDEWEKTEDKLKIFSETELQGQKNDLDKALQEQYELEEKGNADPNKLALMQKKVDMLRQKYLFGANKAKEAIELLKGQGGKPKTMNQWQLFLDAANGDPTKAIELMTKYKQSVGPAVQVNFTKATQSDLEKQQVESEQNIMSFDEIEKNFKPEYLTYGGMAKSDFQKYADKAGIPVDTTFLANRQKFMQQAKSAFLNYRKWITGVAGGEKEFNEIAKAFPDPEKNSPAQFMANLEQAKSWRKKVLNWLRHTRSQGLSISDTPEKLPEKQTQGLSDYTDEELIEMLEQMK